jgi:tRNA threonylcarbamoyladenosine biosynthesis protein TsaB
MDPTLLAFDTSTELMSLAVSRGGKLWVYESPGGALASGQLIARALALVQESGATLADVDAIAFGSGPGAFTGLRTACSVAQGLGLGLGKPVLPVDSLMLVADDAQAQVLGKPGTLVWVAMDARMNEIYAGAYQKNTGDVGWQSVVAPALFTVPALLGHWQQSLPAVVAGSALEVFADQLGLGSACVQVPHARCRASALMRLAVPMWRAGLAVDAALALPVYLRDKVAQTMAQRQALVGMPA